MRATDSVICRMLAWVAASAGRISSATEPGRLLERVQQDADGRDRLADVVVQLARDALALGFERLQHALREALARGLELLPLADVAHDAEHVDRAVDVDARDADLDRDDACRPCRRLMVSNGRHRAVAHGRRRTRRDARAGSPG